MTKEVYKSSTLGEIPLSFTGRHLLQNLREAIQSALDMKEKAPWQAMEYIWRDVSIARGKLAQYMSKLEQRSERPRAYESRLDDTPANFNHPNCRCMLTPTPQPTIKDLGSWLGIDGLLGEAFIIKTKDGKVEAIEPVNHTEPDSEDTTPFGAFGKLVTQFEQQELTGSGGDYHLHLPPIPKGYTLRIVGNIATIEPNKQNEVDESASNESAALAFKKECEAAAKQKQRREKLADYLNEYRNALLAAYGAPAGNPRLQERIDKARLIIFELMESK